MTAPQKVAVRLAELADMAQVYALRHHVFVVGQGVPVELERDWLDEQADHAVAERAGLVVGTGRLVAPGLAEPAATIGRMAVSDTVRGQGVGSAVLARLEERAVERGWDAVELHAQLYARRFYEAAGYSAVGQVFVEAGIEHIGMRKLWSAPPRPYRSSLGCG